MHKSSYFASRSSAGWPRPADLARYFLTPAGAQWFFETENDGASFTGEGIDGTDDLPANKGRIDVCLTMWGHPKLGVLLMYEKWGGSIRETYSSKGDLNKLGDLVRSMHGTPLPVGLFIPFETAWKAVKEFLENDGTLPKSIVWVSNHDLPPNTFPDP